MSGYTVNTKDLEYPQGSGGRDESTYHFKAAQDEMGSYQIPSHGGGNHGPFRPGGLNYLISDNDEDGTASMFATMSTDDSHYNGNALIEKAVEAVAVPGNEAVHLSNLYCNQGRTKSVAYFSEGGRPIATETEDLDYPLDGRPKLPGDDALDTTYSTQTREISPYGKRWRDKYQSHFQPEGAVALAGWAHWRGREEQYGTTAWDYRTHDGGADMAGAVDFQVRRHDTWADEDLDRHTAPKGCGKMGQKCGLPRSEEEKKKREKKKKEKGGKEEEEKKKDGKKRDVKNKGEKKKQESRSGN
ncbi:hypothetical protein PG984_010393 [Apiospora sp. TS-2023a]